MNEKRLRAYYRNKRVLVPGGAGFIGSNVAARMVDLGARVTVVDPFSGYCGGNPRNLRAIRGRIILARKKIENFIDREGLGGFDIIFNCVGLSDHHIGFSDVELDYDINCRATLRVLQALRREKMSGCRMISLGSRSQYGRPGSLSVSESHSLEPRDVQAAHKTALEHYHAIYASRYGLDLIYLRLTNVYGRHQKLKGEGVGAVGEIVRSALTGSEVVIYGSLGRVKDVLHVDDAVEAIAALGMSKRAQEVVYNLGGNLCRLSDLVRAIKKKVGAVNVAVRPFPGDIKKIDAGDCVLNVARLRRRTGWKPTVTIDAGVDATIDYYQKNKGYYL